MPSDGVGTRVEIGSSLVSMLQQSFGKYASNPAVVGLHVLWTYGELNVKSLRLAQVLALAGARHGGVIALLLKRSPSLVLAQVAALRIGAAYSPLDTESLPAHLQAALDVLRPAIILTDGSCDLPPQAASCVIDLRSINLDAPIDADDAWAECRNDDVAYVTFTSGTTGAPKGVMIPHSGISRLVCKPDWASFPNNSRFGFISSPAFDASTLEVWAPLLNGSCCVVQEKPKPSLDDIANFILLNGVTDVFLTSALFSAMTEYRLDSFAGLRQLMTGGERVSPHHARIVLNTYPSLRLINGYGPTENTTFTACRTISVADTENPAGIPIGSPVRGTQIRIEGDSTDENYGELLAGGAGVAIGYLNDADLTARKFVTIDGTRWYRTGDLVRQRGDGALEFAGRIDRQVKVQGHRIELDAIETLLSSMPGIGQCAVFVAGDVATNRHLVATYTLLDSTRPTPSDILTFLRARLPLHSVPRVLRALATMPRNANGKIDHKQLRDLHAAGASSLSASTSKPDTDTEMRLCQLWSELFPSVYIHPLLNFDALGGTSLQALQLSAAVHAEFQKFYSAIQVIRTPVLRDQATIIEQLPVAKPATAHAIDSAEPHELTQIQHSVLAADALDESGCAFLVHVPLRFETDAILARIRGAFEQVAERHPALRLSIDAAPGTYVATVDSTLKTGWLRHHGLLPSPSNGDALPPEVLRVINRPLQRIRDGVMRVDTWGAENQPTLVVWTIHHVAVDEASVDHCLSDLDALLSGKELAPVTGNPLGLAEFERTHTAASAPPYWSTRIVDVLGQQAPALPRAPGYGCEVPVNLPTNLAQEFLEWCRTASVTPFVPLLVAYGRAVQHVFGNDFVFVATPFTRRSDPAIGDTVGCLIDLNIVEAGALPNETPAENLRRVYRVTSKLQECVFFPFARVSEEIARKKSGAERHLNSFAFTWRLAPSRSLMLGAEPARLLRVAQEGARFGMTLHGWLEDGQLRCGIETLNDSVSRERAGEVGRQLIHQLALVSGESFMAEFEQPAPEQTGDDFLFSSKLHEALKQRWILNLGIAPAAFSEDGNYWELGGNSLTALQMFAQLGKEFGVRIDPAEFFALPTFARLHQLAKLSSSRSDTIHDVIGDPDARNLVVCFPGDNGPAIGMHPFGELLQRKLGHEFAVVIVDLLEILRRSSDDDPTASVNNRCLQLFDELGRDRICSLVGFSSGGLTALALAHALAPSTMVNVWLLDTYQTDTELSVLVNQTLRPVVRTLLRSRLLATMARTRVRAKFVPKVSPEYPAGSIEQIREQARASLLQQPAARPTGRAHLIQALKTAREEFLPFNRGTNGFAKAYFKHGSILRIECAHEEILHQYAEQTTTHMAEAIRSLGPSPLTPRSVPPFAR